MEAILKIISTLLPGGLSGQRANFESLNKITLSVTGKLSERIDKLQSQVDECMKEKEKEHRDRMKELEEFHEFKLKMMSEIEQLKNELRN